MTNPRPNHHDLHQAQGWTETALGDAWEALVQGRPVDVPETASFVRGVVEELAAIDHVPPLSHARREQLWAEVMAMAAVPPSPVPMPLRSSRNGATTDASAERLTSLVSPSRVRQTRLGAHVALVALMLSTLIGGFVAFRSSLPPMGPDPRTVIIPAIDSTPATELPLGVIADDILVRATLEQMPPAVGRLQLALYRSRLASGAVEPAGSQADTGVGNDLCTIESGQIAVDADAPVLLTRAVANPASAPSLVQPGTTVVLDVGDQFLAPSGVTFRRRNDGLTSAVMLCFWMGTYGDSARIWSSPPGVTYASGLPFKLPSALPPVPAEATVHRLTLAPGAEVAIRDLPGLELIYVEAGALDLIYAKAETPATPERSFTIRAGSGTETFGRTPDQAVLANRGAEPLVLLIASVVPADAGEATPQPP
jgi:hypothetical protein